MLASLTWRTKQNHTMELLPTLACLLRQMGAGLDSIQAITVAKGPGSFSGLRVGMSTAKGLAFSLNVALIGVSTFEAEAYLFASAGQPIRPILKAGRDELATALYRQRGDELQCLEKENITTLEVLCRRTRQRTLFCGEIPPDVATQLQQALDKRAIISRVCSLSRAGALATLGWRKLNRGERDDPTTLQPLYLRPPHITTPKERMPLIRYIEGRT